MARSIPGLGVTTVGAAGFQKTELVLLPGLCLGEGALQPEGLAGCFTPLCGFRCAAQMDSQEIKELQQEVMEELGISMEELQDIIDEELEKFECIKQRKQQLEELEKCVKQKEEEVAHVDQLFDDASRWACLEL